jgi:hypothetical protein
MNCRQYVELLTYFNTKEKQKAEGEAMANEARTMHQLAKLAAMEKAE